MGDFKTPPEVVGLYGALAKRIATIENSRGTPRYTTDTRPDPTTVPWLIIAVTDGAAGSKFQGSNGTAWVPLG